MRREGDEREKKKRKMRREGGERSEGDERKNKGR